MKKKGSYQISLGMIVGVVFAVIILGLGISWIVSTMKGITSISDSAIEQAKTNILQGTTDRATVLKGKSTIKANEKLEVAIVVGNTYSQPRKFLVVLKGDDLDKFEISNEHLTVNQGGLSLGPLQPNEAGEVRFTLKPITDGSPSVMDDLKNEKDEAKTYTFEVRVYKCDITTGQCPNISPGNIPDQDLYKQMFFDFEVVL